LYSLENCDNRDAIPNLPPLSAEDMATFSAIDSAYEESRLAIEEGKAVLSEIGASASTPTNDTMMGDETAHKKRSASEQSSLITDPIVGQL
jgi:hypothetical protein